eukprot:3321243-Rhodomonas_salina.2
MAIGGSVLEISRALQGVGLEVEEQVPYHPTHCYAMSVPITLHAAMQYAVLPSSGALFSTISPYALLCNVQY